MSLKKPKFWDYKRPNIYSYVLWPLTIIIQIINLIRARFKKQKKFNIRSVCVGNIYIGGTVKTSLSIKINEILIKKKIRSCFIKKSYISQIDEQKLLASRGKLFSAKKRSEALIETENDNYQTFGYKTKKTGISIGTNFEYLNDFFLCRSLSYFLLFQIQLIINVLFLLLKVDEKTLVT